jgi:Zn-dependent peptidase ImmA (M78 family)
MDPSTTKKIQEEARAIHRELWKHRETLFGAEIEQLGDIFPLDCQLVAEKILQVAYFEPPKISDTEWEQKYGKSGFEIAGLIDRNQNCIVVVSSLPQQVKRFTGGHEIGHWVLHPETISHREKPISGIEITHTFRTKIDQEADRFSAELLIPPKLLERLFVELFGKSIKLSEINDSFAFWYSLAARKRRASSRQEQIRLQDLRKMSVREICEDFASFTTWSGRQFRSLAERLGVTPKAVAIQLETLGLIRSN